MTARLFCKTGALAGSEYHIGAEATIGRWDQNDITLSSDAVSGQHARIFYDDEADCYVLDDLDSSSGTRLDDMEVIDPVPLTDLHIITFARTVDFIFHAVEDESVSAATEEGAKTQFGLVPESPSSLPGEDEPDGERTRVGGAPGQLPDLPEEESASEEDGDAPEAKDRTRFGDAPPELPDLSEDDESDEPDGERTQIGQAPDALPDLPDEDSPENEERSSEEEDRTRFGDSPPELPDLSEDDESDEPDGERTQMGQAPDALPDLPDENSPESEESFSEDEDRTRFGDAPPEPPDLPEEPSGEESDDEDEEHTQMGANAPALPDLSEGERSSEDEEETADEVPSLSEGETRTVPGQEPLSPEPSPQYALQVIRDGDPQDTHSLPEGEVTIGRASDCDIQIDDPGVSRQHARLTVEPDEVVVEDVGSKNFTFVNEERLTGPTSLSPGAEIQFGLQAKAILQRASS